MDGLLLGNGHQQPRIYIMTYIVFDIFSSPHLVPNNREWMAVKKIKRQTVRENKRAGIINPKPIPEPYP